MWVLHSSHSGLFCYPTVAFGWFLWASFCNYWYHAGNWNCFILYYSTKNRVDKPQNLCDFFCDSNHRFSKFLSRLIPGWSTFQPLFRSESSDTTFLMSTVFIRFSLFRIFNWYQTDRRIRKPEPSDNIFQRIQSKVDPLLKVLVKMTISSTIISGMVNEL